jgi:hypothetical protein
MSVEAEGASPGRRRWLVYAPLVVFLALAWLLFERLGAGDPASIPSVLIGQPVRSAAHFARARRRPRPD